MKSVFSERTYSSVVPDQVNWSPVVEKVIGVYSLDHPAIIGVAVSPDDGAGVGGGVRVSVVAIGIDKYHAWVMVHKHPKTVEIPAGKAKQDFTNEDIYGWCHYCQQ